MVVIALVACIYRASSSQLNDGVERIKTADMTISNIIDPETKSRPLKNKNIMKSKPETNSNIFIILVIIIVPVVLVLVVCVSILWASYSLNKPHTYIV